MRQTYQAARYSVAPVRIFLLLFVFVLLTGGLAVYVLSIQPWTGIRTEIQPDNPGQLHIKSIAKGSPAEQPFSNETYPSLPLSGLEFDCQTIHMDKVLHLKFDCQTIRLDKLVRTEPLAIRTYQDFDDYLALQGQLYHALSSGQEIALLNEKGIKFLVTPLPYTPISEIPLLFWQLMLVNVFGLVIGTVVWAYRPYRLEAFCLFIAGLSYYCFETIFSVLIVREFCLAPDLMRWLATLESAFLNVFVLALFVIIAYYPSRLVSKNVLRFMAVLALFLSINFHWRWLEIPVHVFVFQFVPIYLLGVWLIYRQWVRSKGRPLDRTAVLVLQLSAVIPCGVIMALYSIPVIIGQSPWLGVVSTRLTLVVIFVGWAIGILRYRLFDVEYWWLKSLLWIVGGVLVLLIEMILLAVLNAVNFSTSNHYALGLSIIVAGFLYFPVRQWLVDRFLPEKKQSLQDFIPAFSKSMSGAISQASFSSRWESSLKKRYRPLSLKRLCLPVASTSLEDNGLGLIVPCLDGQTGYQLMGKQMATRLFNLQDVKDAASLLTVARMASNASHIRHQAITEERQRIMHDLHDTVGAKLMTLAHKLDKPESKTAVRDVLATLRDTVRLSLKESPLYLGEHAIDWRAEVSERADAAGVELDWQQESMGVVPLQPMQVLALTQIMRELVTNALKHAGPENLVVKIRVADGALSVSVANDGKVTAPESWKAGTGMTSLQKRITELGGQLRVFVEDTRNCLWLRVDVSLRITNQ